ncbi:MAG: transglutaminase-like domain-containing protein [Planctomycetota bacterium]|nr:transglutaminase-like domain-containing protein [Planctomycetota bacterium]
MRRRQFLTNSSWAVGGAMACGSVSSYSALSQRFSESTSEHLGPIHSFDPVVGDGRWIWREPPKTDRGYLEPRSYDLSIGVELRGTGGNSEVMAATPVPVNHPEQKVEEVTIEKIGCDAVIRELAPGAGQLLLHAPNIMQGQVVKAIAHYKITLYKQYHGFEKKQFPTQQTIPNEIRAAALGESPGIQAKAPAVKKLATEIAYGLDHPWDQAHAFVEWIQKKIRPQYGPYTSVLTAIEKRVGDCEEMSALFVAFCRALGIPARLVWVPNHNWTEFYLTDEEQIGHWIPVHPACYHWFGWTGAHELVIQKGDRVRVPEQNKTARLIMDWVRSSGGRPQTNYVAQLTPLPPTLDGDAGPGTRSKDSKTGEWKITGKHEFDRFARR